MAKFIIRRLLLMLLTMLIVSVAVFLITEAAPGNVARNVLGVHITPEQEASFLNQQGLDEPFYERYFNWLIGTDWRASRKVGLKVKKITRTNEFSEWWAVAENGSYVRWEMEGEDLIAEYLHPDGSLEEVEENFRWEVKSPPAEIERLSAYRTSLTENQQLSADDREKILHELDRILEILSQDQPLSSLDSALEEPESRLSEMIDQQALRQKSILIDTAKDVTRRNTLIRAVNSYQQVAAVGEEELNSDTRQSLVRLYHKVGDELKENHPGLASQFARAAEHLDSEDLSAAEQELAKAVSTLDQLLGHSVLFLEELKNERYSEAADVLETWSDLDQVPLDSSQLTVFPALVEEIGSGFDDDVPLLSEPLLEAAERMRDGDTDKARELFEQAAENFRQLTSTIVQGEAARGARAARSFWGVNSQNLAVQWEKGTGKVVWRMVMGSGWIATTGGPVEYIPLQKGLLRGDPGLSLRTGRPVADLLFTRLRNSLVLAGIAFVLVMPIALVLGLIAGLNEGKLIDRVLSIGGMMFSVTPEFATGIFLILIFAFWLDWVPGATVFGEQAPWERPEMLILPVLTLTLIELGYVLRITRASMSDVMKAPYIRTAYLKGLPQHRVVLKHAIRNALMSPITVIMLHVNWLLGGIVVVEVIFGYPGLGSYLLDSALFKDFNAIEGGAMILVAVAVGTQLIADIIYTFLNPRIRYD